MSSAGSSNTASLLFEIAPGATVNLDSTKGYWLVNADGVSSANPNSKSVLLIERQTGRQLSLNIYGIMKLDGKKFASVTNNSSGGTLYITDDFVDAPDVYLTDLLATAIQKFLYNPLTAYTSSVYTYLTTLAITTTAQTLFSVPEAGISNYYPFVLYFTSFGAASGETDTLTAYDNSGNVYLTQNITGLQNQNILLPLNWNSGSQPYVSVIASGVTSPTGKITYSVYEGAI